MERSQQVLLYMKLHTRTQKDTGTNPKLQRLAHLTARGSKLWSLVTPWQKQEQHLRKKSPRTVPGAATTTKPAAVV